MNQPEDNFIGRWSRRKKNARNEQATATESEQHTADAADPSMGVDGRAVANENHQQAAATATEAAAKSPGEQALADDAALTDDDMVDINTLDANSDYTPFMSEGVSSELRKAALKKLFFSGKFAARDGLDDYDDDFTYFEPLGDTVTSDMKFHARRKEKERLAKLEEERLALEAQAHNTDADTEGAKRDDAVPEEVNDNSEADTGQNTRTDSDNGSQPEASGGSDTSPGVSDPARPQHASAAKLASTSGSASEPTDNERVRRGINEDRTGGGQGTDSGESA